MEAYLQTRPALYALDGDDHEPGGEGVREEGCGRHGGVWGEDGVWLGVGVVLVEDSEDEIDEVWLGVGVVLVEDSEDEGDED